MSPTEPNPRKPSGLVRFVDGLWNAERDYFGPLGDYIFGCLTVLFLAAVVFGVVVVIRTRMPLLTEADYDHAVERWKEQGPKSYQLDVQVGGWQPGEIHAVVRNGVVTEMTRNGVAPNRKDAGSYWTVDYLLELIGDDLELQQNPEKMSQQFNIPPDSAVTLRAQFDSEFGYPVRYRRSIAGTHMDVEWTVTRFGDPADDSR